MRTFSDPLDFGKRPSRLFPPFVWALSLHAAAYLGLIWLATKRPTEPILRPSQAIKVRIVSHPAATRPKPPAAGTGDRLHPPAPPSPSPSRRTRGPSTPAYKDLFPLTGEEMSSAEEPELVPQTAKVAQELQVVTEELSGKLDIPLFFRQQAEDAKAVAKITRDASSTLRFAYIEGAPLLRAVVYDALRTPSNRTLLNAWLDQMQASEVVISFHLRTLRVSRPPTREEESLRFTRGRVSIERTMFLYDGTGSGASIPLPDEEADRAKLRDRIHLDRLMLSPAFHAPIRDRIIGE